MPDADSLRPLSDQPLFATHAAGLHGLGLCPIPCGGAGGKVPLIGWKGWRRRPGAKVLGYLVARPDFAAANIGILTGLSRTTIVDSDDAGTRNRRSHCLIVAI